ncbi:homoserine kinase [Methyloprofundus sp.]|uniref:homoserine kinase n=1 Tax=Methyloprofundus sp. TaxID=2020875 RepID=UPI003D0EF01B
MSVYTSLSRTEIESVLSRFHLSQLIRYSGISAGIENTNYLIQTAQGDFVLTLYEHFAVTEIKQYLNLLGQLAEHASYYPLPLADTQHQYLQRIAEKPAALFACLPGKSVEYPSHAQLKAVAEALARFHQHSSNLTFNKMNPRNMQWMQESALQVSPDLSEQDAKLLDDELSYQRQYTTLHLPQGIIHADLFKDNVLFAGDSLTAMLDFYVACRDCYLLDIAIALNDWCVDQNGQYSYVQHRVFIAAYQQVRVLDQQEENYLPVLLRRACLRFWLSRLEHKLNPREGEMTQEKDPQFFKKLLLQHRQFNSQQETS